MNYSHNFPTSLLPFTTPPAFPTLSTKNPLIHPPTPSHTPFPPPSPPSPLRTPPTYPTPSPPQSPPAPPITAPPPFPPSPPPLTPPPAVPPLCNKNPLIQLPRPSHTPVAPRCTPVAPRPSLLSRSSVS